MYKHRALVTDSNLEMVLSNVFPPLPSLFPRESRGWQWCVGADRHRRGSSRDHTQASERKTEKELIATNVQEQTGWQRREYFNFPPCDQKVGPSSQEGISPCPGRRFQQGKKGVLVSCSLIPFPCESERGK